MAMTAEQLLSIARNYWPADKDEYLRPEKSPAVARFQALWRQELGKMDGWTAFVRSLDAALSGFTVTNVTVPVDACLRCAAYPEAALESASSRWVVVGCVSILAPVYTVYGVRYEFSGKRRVGDHVFFEPLPAEMQAPAAIMGRNIETRWGIHLLPREVSETPIHLFVDPQQPPHTTLFHALFTSQPASVP
ncbi:hypothetical protein [Hyalangium versicolor]|uniref:hypothetical protein n=1 Tax=Hyalangium versicolor TaxID=2861190 RepID=UPI001CD01E05|nr:hypothetical protein [Hyalangium versicolor]